MATPAASQAFTASDDHGVAQISVRRRIDAPERIDTHDASDFDCLH
jgi:hypothetical protein